MHNVFYPTAKDINGCIDILRTLNCLPKWKTRIQDGYTEIAYIGFTNQIAAIMFWYVLHEQLCKIEFTEYPTINFNNLPRLAIFHAFEAYEKHDIPEEIYQKLFENHEVLEGELLASFTNDIIKLTSSEFFYHITNFNNELEIKIYEAAKALAGYYEILEAKVIMREEDFSFFHEAQLKKLEKHKKFPIIRDLLKEDKKNPESEYTKLRKLFNNFSVLRHCTRWERRNPIIRYSVLGHSFDVALYNYLLSLNSYPSLLNFATSNFLVGLYHDIAEIWTGDIPMPLKTSIPNLRPRIIELELNILDKNVFPLLPEWLITDFKGVMIELVSTKKQSQCKQGDSLAAYIEAATQLANNTGDNHYKKVVFKGIITMEKLSPTMKKVMRKIRKDAHISIIAVWYCKAKKFFTKNKQ